MAVCKKCPEQMNCHDISLGDLQMIRAIDGFYQIRDLVKLEKAIGIFWRRLLERHNQLTRR